VAALLRGSGRDEVAFVGTPDGLEARLVPEAGIRFLPLAARGFDRARPLSLVTAAFVTLASTVRAWRLIARERPDVVVGFGGYVSLPLGLAAVSRRVPLVQHEQNSVPGLANKVLSRWAGAVGVTYPDSARRLKHPDRAVVTGNPVREAVREARRASGRDSLGVPPEALLLLVFGGSQGARHLNEAMVALAPRLASVPRLRVVHVAGTIDYASVAERLRDVIAGSPDYRLIEFLDDMASALAAADLVVARAGATSIAEITTIGLPSVLVPYPYATDDHQRLNALAVETAGAGVVVSDADLDGPVFGETVMRLLDDAGARARMAAASKALGLPCAAERVTALARQAAGT
jgi:UDP-N-acetylglucosamine--N-acetylmuramyl-(pentapeptide) pyrophosphoryl-undecaprenol N-acetylglucosamine transferase